MKSVFRLSVLGGVLLGGMFVETLHAEEAMREVHVNRKDFSQVIPTGEGVENGEVFKIALEAPGKINRVEYSCDGHVCGWVYPCPDGGKCLKHPYEFELNGSTATFYGWSNSADNGIFVFRIYYNK